MAAVMAALVSLASPSSFRVTVLIETLARTAFMIESNWGMSYPATRWASIICSRLLSSFSITSMVGCVRATILKESGCWMALRGM